MNQFSPAAVPKKAAVINDLTGFGRCSLAVILPVISSMKVQACPVPTSIFSNHMGFSSYAYEDLTNSLSSYLKSYDTLHIAFDGIYCGFLNSPDQFHIISDFFKQQAIYHPLILIDPVMGDHGKLYRIVTKEICQEMKHLISFATVLTPNLTEACLLTDTPFPDQTVSLPFLQEISGKLHELGPSHVVITGITDGMFVGNYGSEKTDSKTRHFFYQIKTNGESRPGTGDIFASILTASLLRGISFENAVHKAADFIRLCVDASSALGVPAIEGVIFENYLSLLSEAKQ